jgi:hypothetical protein
LHLCPDARRVRTHGQFVNDTREKRESHPDGDVFLVNCVAVGLLIYERGERHRRAGRERRRTVGHPYRKMIFISQFDLHEIVKRVSAVQGDRAGACLAYREANLVEVGLGYAGSTRDCYADKTCGADVSWCRRERQADSRHVSRPLAGRAGGGRFD